MYTALILLLVLALNCASVRGSELKLDPVNGHAAARCKVTAQTPKHVWIFKQWHADAGVDTHDRAKAKLMPQAVNQTAIYRQLAFWVTSNEVKTVVCEGCSGELSHSSKINFNGWTVAELEGEASRPHYDDEIVASVPEKIKARYGARVQVLCGDDDALIRQHLLAFSDVRGTFGFLSRIIQYKDDPKKLRGYLDGAVELYKLPKNSSVAIVLERLKAELRLSLERLRVALDQRNVQALKAIRAAPDGQVAVVYGGLHAAGLMDLLEKSGIGCTVVEPTGYQSNEEQLMRQLEKSIAAL